MENPSKMETNELPEEVKRKIEEEANKLLAKGDRYWINAAEYGYRLALQSKEEELSELRKIQSETLEGLNRWIENCRGAEEQLKAKDEELAKLKAEYERLSANALEANGLFLKMTEEFAETKVIRDAYAEKILRQNAKIDSLTSENEKLKSFEAQNERMRLWFEERTRLKGDFVLLSEHMAKIDSLLTQSTDKPNE